MRPKPLLKLPRLPQGERPREREREGERERESDEGIKD